MAGKTSKDARACACAENDSKKQQKSTRKWTQLERYKRLIRERMTVLGVYKPQYYPQEDGFSTNSVEGYMNRTEDSLTVLVDINGDGSKLLIKINGLKALM